MLGIYQTSIQDFFAREDQALRSGDALSARERQLVESYRRLTGEDRREVDGYVDFKLYKTRRDRPHEPATD